MCSTLIPFECKPSILNLSCAKYSLILTFFGHSIYIDLVFTRKQFYNNIYIIQYYWDILMHFSSCFILGNISSVAFNLPEAKISHLKINSLFHIHF